MHSPLRGPSVDAFVGRLDELRELARLTQSNIRLITMRGTGGVGKTRLARHFARTQPEHTAYFIDLTEARSLAGIAQATGRVLELVIQGDDDQSMCGTIGAGINQLGPSIIILDNFEQIVEHAADTVASWLHQAPEATFIVTSRQALGIRGEHVLALDPMGNDDGADLFLLRATACGASWVEDPNQRPEIEALVQALDGIPLAIELAAARSVLLTPAAIRSRLDRKLGILGRGQRDHTERQATVSGLIDWSWSLLTEAERSALAQLSVFHGGFSLGAAEAVVSVPNPTQQTSLGLVESLVSKSLLRVQHINGQARVDMYASVHAFAIGKMQELTSLAGREQCEAAQAHRRHARYYAELLGVQHTAVSLRGELDNLLVAQNWCIDHNEMECLFACTKLISNIFMTTGPWTAGVKAIRRSLDEGISPPEQRWDLLRDLFLLLQRASRFEEADICVKQAQEISHQLDDPQKMYSALSQKARLLIGQGLLKQGHACFLEAVDIAQAANLHERFWVALSNAAFIAIEIGLLEEGLRHLQQPIPDQETGNMRIQGAIFCHYGRYNYALGRLTKARTFYEKSLENAHTYGDNLMEAVVLGRLGELELDQGNLKRARVKLESSIDMIMGSIPSHARRVQGTLALVHAKAGDLAQAQKILDSALSSPGGFLWPTDRVMLYLRDAQVQHLCGDSDRAKRALQKVQEQAQALEITEQSALSRAINEFRDTLIKSGATSVTLTVDSDIKWFAVGDAGRVWVARRKAIRRILRTLVERRTKGADAIGLSVAEAFIAGWPDDRATQESQRDRVYTAIGSLRTMGLGDLLLRRPDGYALDPAVPLQWHQGND